MGFEMQSVRALVLLSLRDPAAAARFLISSDLRRDVLWTLLLLISAGNAVLVWSSFTLTGPSAQELSNMPLIIPAILFSPLISFVFLSGSLVIGVHLLHWMGRVFGGTGQLKDMLAVLIWLQCLRLLAQVLLLVLMLVMPFLSGLVGLGVAVMSLWILVHFVNEAARLGSLWKTIGMLLAAAACLIFGLSLLLSTAGMANIGLNTHV